MSIMCGGRNRSGCSDPTANAAIAKVYNDNKHIRTLRKATEEEEAAKRKKLKEELKNGNNMV